MTLSEYDDLLCSLMEEMNRKEDAGLDPLADLDRAIEMKFASFCEEKGLRHDRKCLAAKKASVR